MIEGKRGSGSKPRPDGEGQSIPSKEDLRRTICEILKKVDFNMVSFSIPTPANCRSILLQLLLLAVLLAFHSLVYV